jgi:hypothetical protein
MKFFLGSLLEINHEELPFREKLAKRIEAHFDAILVDPQLPLFLFNEINSNPKRLQQLRERLGALPEKVFRQMKAELDVEIAQGRIRPITIYDLLLSIVSLNIMIFISEPMFKAITGISDEDFIRLREKRKTENVNIILKSLEP